MADMIFFEKIDFKIPLFLLHFLAVLMLQSCYSGTAVKGIPVNELPGAKDKMVTRIPLSLEQREQLTRWSEVKKNKVFMEINGVSDYRIGPLDILEINSRTGQMVKTEIIPVDSTGMIYYSFFDSVDVTGLTVSQLDDLLTKKLSAYIKSPRIDIRVTEYNSKSALLLGEISSLRSGAYGKSASGKINLKGKVTLLDLIAQAGGYTEQADIKDLKLIRGGESYRINLYDIIERGNEKLNIIIDDGDVIDIPDMGEFKERIYVMGEVMSQGVYELKSADNLLAALALAGNVTSLAVEKNTLIVRAQGIGEKPLIMMSDVEALLRKGDLSQNIRLLDGDLVYVPRMFIGDINDFIDNTEPLLNFLFWPDKYKSTYYIKDYLKQGGTK